ncbi:MAG TPA: SMP-30/gluconolactonase/LRE family protein [Quisquiliibacterium sp.]|nr:SMP-30/gluconolactonase/LRE family protein [Quisquiliibacterium sp.]
MQIVDHTYTARCLVEGTALRGSCGMAFDADGNVLVGHVFSARVSRIDLTTGAVSAYVDHTQGLIGADDITSDGRGTCWTSCTSALAGESVFRIDAGGRARALYAGLAGANGILFDRRTGRLFVGQFGAGNGLYEIDPDGLRPPRLITKAFASTNAMDVDREGQLLVTVDGGRIARVDPDTGAFSVLDVRFPHNSALKVGRDGELYVTGYVNGFGMLWRVAPDGTSMQTLSEGVLPPLDNLLYAPDGRLFVSSLRDATVIEFRVDGEIREVRRFSASGPPTIGAMTAHGDVVLVNDGLSVRRLDRAARTLEMTAGSFYARRGFPVPGCLHFAPDGVLYMTPGAQSSMAGITDARVYAVDTADYGFRVVNAGMYQGVHGPSALWAEGPDLYVAEFVTGRVLALDRGGDDTRRRVVLEGVHGPLGMAVCDGVLYVAESLGQRISALELATGRRRVLVSAGLGRPGAMTCAADGALIVLDAHGGRVLRIAPRTGAVATLATGLAVHPMVVSHWPLVAVMNGLACDASGAILIGCNADGAVWCLERARA